MTYLDVGRICQALEGAGRMDVLIGAEKADKPWLDSAEQGTPLFSLVNSGA